MQVEHIALETLSKTILDVLSKHIELSAYRVFFFGSRVSGTHSPQSDIDLGIEGKSPVPGATMTRIREDLEDLPFLYTIDLVDFTQVSEEFRQIALQHIHPLQ